MPSVGGGVSGGAFSERGGMEPYRVPDWIMLLGAICFFIGGGLIYATIIFPSVAVLLCLIGFPLAVAGAVFCTYIKAMVGLGWLLW